MISTDKAAIDALVTAFFSVFNNKGGATPALGMIYDLFIPRGLIIKDVGPALEVCSLQEFIEPRRSLLESGSLTDFVEHETSEKTDIVGNVAQRLSLYRKSGVMAGAPFEGRGVKVFQFVRTPAGWRISSMAWDDERVGLALDSLPTR